MSGWMLDGRAMGGLLAALLLCGACSDSKEDSDSPPPVETEPQESVDDCVGGAAPVITEIELENSGIQAFDEGDFPTITIWVTAEDEDWDLASYKLEVYYDDQEDGSVAADAGQGFVKEGTLSDDGDCTAPSGTVGLIIGLAGGGIEYDSLYEFGAIVTDANEISSEMAVKAGYTPTSTGEDGGP